MKDNKHKDFNISEQDSQLFRQAMADVKPLKSHNNRKAPKKQPAATPSKKSTPYHPQLKPQPKSANPLNDIDLSTESIPDQVNAETYLFYSKSPLRPKLKRQLTQGKIIPQATLDLHEHTLEKAEHALSQFIEQALMTHKRYLRIIHGKSRGAEIPPIKNHVNRWLTVHSKVVAFCSCPPEQGGRGAVNVIISKPSKE